jgi:tetratricopeptide (TPR) repeat protein
MSTIAVNLRDSPPFASVAGPRLSTEDRNACDNLLKASVAALQQTNYVQAAENFAQAASLDPDRADIEFYLGGCLLRLTNVVAARQHYQRACDLDALPFRSDSIINSTLADAGRKYAGSDLAFFDAVRTLAMSSPVGIPGAESFYEHVHFNFDGNYRLGRAWAEQIAGFVEQGSNSTDSKAHASSSPAQTAAITNQLDGANSPSQSLLSTPKEAFRLSEWASQNVCERRLGLTDWNRAAVFEDVLRRFTQPPLSAQPNNNSRWEALHKKLNQIREHLDAAAVTNARQVYLEALQRAPEDERLHENFAEFLEDTGQLGEAEAQWEQVRELIPQHHLGYFESGRLLLRLSKLPEARARLHQAVELRPDLGEGWLELGNIDALEGKPEHALTQYKRAQQLTPQDPRPYYHMGKALSKLGKPVQAVQQLRLAIKAQPAFWEAHYALGEELAFMGMVEAARGEFEQTLRLKPDYAMAHLNLGVALLQNGKIESAVKELHEAQRLDPKVPLAADYLKKIEGKANEVPKERK